MLTSSSLLLLPSSSPIPAPFNFCKKNNMQCNLFPVCVEANQPPTSLQERAHLCRAGGEAPAKTEASQHCVVQAVVWDTWGDAVHRHAVLWGGRPVHKTEGAERGAAWRAAGGGVVCADCHGITGLCFFFFFSILYRYNCFLCVFGVFQVCVCVAVLLLFVFWVGRKCVCVRAFLFFFALFCSSIFLLFFSLKKVRSRQKNAKGELD